MSSDRINQIFVRLALQLFTCVLLIGCLTPFDFRLGNNDGLVVISGQISNLSDQNIVEVGITSDEIRLPIPENNAIVILYDEVGIQHYYNKDDEKPGVYALSGYSGEPGKSYFIEVTMPNGEIYRSKNEKMPDAAGQLSTHYKINSKDFIDAAGILQTEPIIEVYANSILNNNKNRFYIRWYLEESYMILMTAYPGILGPVPPPCIVTQAVDPQRIVLFNGAEINTNKVEDQLLGSRIVDKAFYYKYYFNTYQHSITKEAHEYWQQVNILANQIGSIFDSPPAKIIGNIYNINNVNELTAGYFQVANSIVDRTFITRYNLPFDLPSYCDYDIFRNPFIRPYPKECSDCLSVRNSSIKRPDWFE